MMGITQPMAESIFKAYCELFGAVESRIETNQFFKLREQFRAIQRQVQEHVAEQEQLGKYRDFAYREHNDDGHLEIDDSAIVSASEDISVSEDGGAYVQAWVWVETESLTETLDGEPSA